MQALRHADTPPRALAPCVSGRCTPPPGAIAGTIAGYAAVFGRVDAQSDVIAPGAFARSLARHARAGTWPAMLWQHEAREPIGRWGEIVEDRIGLRATGELVLDTRRGREAAALMRAGALTGLSIGYVAVESHRDRARGVRVLTEIDLIEISPVTFPAQPLARIAAASRRIVSDDVWSAFRRARAALALPERRFIAPPSSSARPRSDHWRTQPRVPRGDPEGGQWTDEEGSSGFSATPLRSSDYLPVAFDGAVDAVANPALLLIRILAHTLRGALRRLPKVDESDEESLTEALRPRLLRPGQKVSTPSSVRPRTPYVQFDSHRQMTRNLGPIGRDYDFHHIVPQNRANIVRFGEQRIHNTNNVVIVTKNQHSCINRIMNSMVMFGGKYVTLYVALGTASYEKQYLEGIRIAKGCGVPI